MDVSPSTAIRNISAGPNHSATPASDGASNSSVSPLIKPPVTDANVAIRMASTARPCRVSSYPSREVAADAEVPGIFNKIAENDPPKMPAA